jgi:hypothetical protein
MTKNHNKQCIHLQALPDGVPSLTLNCDTVVVLDRLRFRDAMHWIQPADLTHAVRPT